MILCYNLYKLLKAVLVVFNLRFVVNSLNIIYNLFRNKFEWGELLG